MDERQAKDRFHGRVRGSARRCGAAGCAESGEFRAPSGQGDDWQWLCLDHVRAFNARYNYFSGMSRAEIEDAQMPLAGWATETRAFAQGSVDRPPRWADFHDPLDAIAARFRNRMPKQRSDGKQLSGEDRRDLRTLGLGIDADRRALRTRYSELVRKYHPDRNGGDRSHERALGEVITAYQRLKGSAAFA